MPFEVSSEPPGPHSGLDLDPLRDQISQLPPARFFFWRIFVLTLDLALSRENLSPGEGEDVHVVLSSPVLSGSVRLLTLRSRSSGLEDGPSLGYNGMLQVGGGGGAQQSSKGTGYRLARPGETEDRVSGIKAEPYSLFGAPKEVRAAERQRQVGPLYADTTSFLRTSRSSTSSG